MAFNHDDFENLKNLVGGEEDEDIDPYEHLRGSALNPATMTGKKPEEMADPNTKIEAKINRRNQPLESSSSTTGVGSEAAKKALADKKSKENDIWAEDEVQEHFVYDPDDTRERPDYDILYKQRVGTQDVYFGTDMDPSTTTCQDLLMKIKMPGAKLAEISLDVQTQAVNIQSSKYVLHHVLPYKVEKDKGNAKWDRDTETLILTLPIQRDW
eukprot:CAMPEP_0115005364 /NCGR_PEP_ID=MMETSP0216-20121206/19813_1 /TAXON_ID=223996 /ORGANISM="Protocruzia adherens, Strain Boccale" /LENGTH=211 /DNA_ID=CAMNT_0002371647 /DNA_START=46 /DNA_END=678 /DNA_ORIENTATION=+